MKTLIRFELAKLLKEKEFNEPIKQRYFIAENIDSDRFPFLQKECALYNWNNYDDFSISYYSAPTVVEVVMWLYEKHDIWIEVSREYANGKYIYQYFIDKNNQEFGFNSPTEAYESAIEYTLKNLIQ